MDKSKQIGKKAVRMTIKQYLLISEKRLDAARFSITPQNDHEEWKAYEIRLQSDDLDVRAQVLVSKQSNPYACAVCIQSFHDKLRDPDNWFHPYSWNHLHISL